MSVVYNPSIVRDGLVAYLDADNPKSYNPAENLLQYSQALTTSPWANSNCNSTNSQPAPDGTNTATLYTCNGTAPTLFFQTTTTSVTGTGILTSSVYAKASTSTTFTFNTYYTGDTEVNITFTLTGAGSTSDAANSSIVAVGNGWYRCAILTPARVNAGTDLNWRIWPTVRATATAGLGCFFWGAQLNKGNYLRPYTVTTSSAIAASTTWVDLTGYGNDVTLNNAPAWNGYYFDLNGTNQWMNDATPNLPTGISGSTQLVWCWPDSTSTADNYVGLTAYGGRTSSNSRLLSLYVSGTTMYVSMAYWGNDWVPNNVAVTANSWNMCGLSATGASYTNNTTLINGNGSGIVTATGSSSSYATTMATTSINLSVGCTDYPGRYLKGRIATVMYYNRQLSPDELQQNFVAMKGRFGL